MNRITPTIRMQRGMDTIVCPIHPNSSSHVADSRGTTFRGLPSIRRRRRCRKCGLRWTTYEFSGASLERLTDCMNQALCSIIDTAKAAIKMEAEQ